MQKFYAYISRMKLIQRWGLMRNTQSENDMEHSLQVAIIAHGLANIANMKYKKNIDTEHVLALAIYHDVSEVITGDLPTPIKYHNNELKGAYKKLEHSANGLLLDMLNKEYRNEYEKYLIPDTAGYEWKLVKAADRLCAYIKCIEEEHAGNKEFLKAKESILKSIKSMNIPEVDIFMEESMPCFAMSLDELSVELN